MATIGCEVTVLLPKAAIMQQGLFLCSYLQYWNILILTPCRTKWNTVVCREGSRTGHWSFCPSSGTKVAIKNRIPLETVWSSRLLLSTAQDSHTAPLSLLPAVSRSQTTNIPFVVLSESCLQSTCATCPWQVKRIFCRRSRVAASTVQPPIHPTVRSPTSPVPPSISPSCFLNIELPG